MSIEFVATDKRGVGTADKRRSTQIPGLFYPRQSEFIRGSSSRLPYPRIWEREVLLFMVQIHVHSLEHFSAHEH